MLLKNHEMLEQTFGTQLQPHNCLLKEIQKIKGTDDITAICDKATANILSLVSIQNVQKEKNLSHLSALLKSSGMICA